MHHLTSICAMCAPPLKTNVRSKTKHIQTIVLSCSAGCNSASIHSTTIWQQASLVERMYFEWKIHGEKQFAAKLY